MLSPRPNDPANHWMVQLWADYCTKFSVCVPEYEPLPELDEHYQSLMDSWYSYADKFGIAYPEDQLSPDIWGKDVPEQDKDQKINAHRIKNWKHWADTRAFLRDRYAEYGTLREPALVFDCLVPQFQHEVPISPQDRYVLGYPKEGDSPEWYADAIQMTIREGQVRFRCRSRKCERIWCDLKKRPSVDIYGLIKVFHGFTRMFPAVQAVAEWFGLDLGQLESKGKTKVIVRRYKVSCKAINELIERYPDFRDEKIGSGEKLKRFIKEAADLIRKSPLEEYKGQPASKGYVYLAQSIYHQGTLWKMGTAAKLYLWMWCYQSEQAKQRKTRFNQFKPSDAKLAEMWGLNRDTVKEYRKHLKDLGYFIIEDGEWKVFFDPKKGTSP